MRFTRLRLSGFKSFVEPTELFVEPGLTAIVGPNGCGKSNLFDALRWVMGETRPTSVRGGEMDDVIFGGTAGRPSRNTAEVILYIDNFDRSAPVPYNECDAIEVSRRIEREAGSVYRINGRDVRQRDVQVFFADASSGAGSTAFVRQGQIGLLISQKPLARRAILEEAAGIGGLHQRRHEAELRLKAADANMARLDDIIRELETGLQSLRKQARQASRYRNLSGLIRKAEALALHLRWLATQQQLSDSQRTLHAATLDVARLADTAAAASSRQAESAARLPPLRQTESERAAALHRLVVQREALDAEEARAREEAQRLRQRIDQTEQDLARERTLDSDAGSAIATLDRERASLEVAVAQAQGLLSEAHAHLAFISDDLRERERTLDRLTAQLAEWHAQKSGHERTRQIAAALRQSTQQQLESAQAALDNALAQTSNAPNVRTWEEKAELAARELETLREALDQAQRIFEHAEREEALARAPFEEVERQVQQLSAEAAALRQILRPAQDLWPPLIDAVTVQPGYEAAFAAVVGSDIDAPIDEAAPHHWRVLGDLEPVKLPAGAEPLSSYVRAPQALARRLSMTGVVALEQGKMLQGKLCPGQRLVSIRGDLWRWDGYTGSADAPSSAAVQLAQRNRLAAIEGELAKAKSSLATHFAQYDIARTAVSEARERVRSDEVAHRAASTALIAAQAEVSTGVRAAAERASHLASLEAEIRRLTQTREAAHESEQSAANALAQLADGAALTEAVAKARAETADGRTTESRARGEVDSLARKAAADRERLVSIADDSARWGTRQQSARDQVAEHQRRDESLRRELTLAEARPAEIAERRSALLGAIATAEAARNETADLRAIGEAELREADKAAKAADGALSQAREARARAEALAEAARSRHEELQIRIRDELDAEPNQLAAIAGLGDGQDLPDIEQADGRLDKLKREREQLGGVNLRAEEEAREQEERLNALIADRSDLEGAIERLRRGIQSLNREGRDRLLASFEKVNENFQSLFTKLFQGGEAKLTFTESDDPLEAGLEIYARPPGKRLQNLALLSGGEQALTALALIFAVFLVNPAPVCVLDEVDAPLDDANVERFCNLLDEMTRLTETRFLVITHHALTMSRMHRLFGVTMAERGVSQLVSVNLAQARQVIAAE
ncbi:MAG: chromosome segregation protein SMC [Alphaproteobacteria bacterium]|nr:chromosome segregation protein SMC [Alphaproteobacteria bacterium]